MFLEIWRQFEKSYSREVTAVIFKYKYMSDVYKTEYMDSVQIEIGDDLPCRVRECIVLGN